MGFKIAQINLVPPKRPNTTSDIFVAQPDSIREELAGKLFVLIEIEDTGIHSLKIINFLIDRINYNYYQNEKILLRERISTLKVEHIFETALAKTNTHFFEFIKSEKLKIDPKTINITVGVLHENTLYFSSTGKNKVLLIYRLPGQTIAPSSGKEAGQKKDHAYQTSDITNKSANRENAPLDKLFSDVISGPIPPHSQFLITNETLPEYISNKELVRIVSSLPPVSAIEQIKNMLSRVNSYVTFLALVIKSTTLINKEEISSEVESSTYESISGLNRTEETTEGLLTPSGIFKIKNWLALRKTKKSEPNKRSARERPAVLKDNIYLKRKPIQIFSKFFSILKNITYYIINIFYYLFKLLADKDSFLSANKKIFSNTKNLIAAIFNKYLGLSNKNKLLLAASLIFLVFFLVSTTLNQVEKSKEEEVADYQALTELIEKKQIQAEANLLYSNEEGAQSLFEEINKLMEQLPQITEEQKQKFEQFKGKFEEQLEKIQRVIRIDSPTEIANFSNLNSRANPINLVYLPSQNKLYSADIGEKSFYILETKSNLVTTVTDLEAPIAKLDDPVVIDDNTIFYLNDANIIAMNTENESLSNRSINFPSSRDAITGADSYDQRLYLLSPEKNQIYRYNSSGSSLSPPYAWVQEQIDLSGAVDISIDGHVYVLKDSGELIKMLRGQLVSFKLETIDPPLNETFKVFVSFEGKNIYILEPKTRRLVLFDKTGQFDRQYKFTTLADMKDFVVDENAGKIYLLNNTSVYYTDAVHLEE